MSRATYLTPEVLAALREMLDREAGRLQNPVPGRRRKNLQEVPASAVGVPDIGGYRIPTANSPITSATAVEFEHKWGDTPISLASHSSPLWNFTFTNTGKKLVFVDADCNIDQSGSSPWDARLSIQFKDDSGPTGDALPFGFLIPGNVWSLDSGTALTSSINDVHVHDMKVVNVDDITDTYQVDITAMTGSAFQVDWVTMVIIDWKG